MSKARTATRWLPWRFGLFLLLTLSIPAMLALNVPPGVAVLAGFDLAALAFIASLTGLEPLPVGRNAVSLGWHGNALLARPGIHLTGVEHLDLPGHEPRGAVIVDLDTPAPLRVVAVHLGLLRSARRAQIDAIKAALTKAERQIEAIGASALTGLATAA